MPTETVVPKPAATVLLLRDDPNPPPGRHPLQVFLQRRVAGMAFAGGMTVFPGGGVDPSDRPDPARWSGPSPARWGERLACGPEMAGSLVHAAVRETFEECGVLLAGPGPVPHHEREALVAHRRTLGQVLTEARLTLNSELLAAWSRWVTPEQSPKRYDTAFFVARVPEGQQADAHTTEAVEATWWHPATALEHWERGDMQLLAPTFTSLREIAEHPDAASVLAAAEQRVITPIIPMVRREGDQVVVVLPGDPGFETAEMHLTPGEARMTHPFYEELRAVTPLASVLLARNPSAMTLEGTNSWVLRAPGVEECVVVDPGDEDDEHLKRVAEQGPVALVLLTHRHHDHAGGAARFAELTGAPVRALDRSLVLGSEALGDGDVVEAAGVELRVVATPGHTSDSLSFLLSGPDTAPVVLTGDTILGRGTTVIAHPDGVLGPYLESLRRLADLAPGTAVLPGHGPELPDAPAVAQAYLAHREQRLDQVRAALGTLGPQATARQVVETVYADVDQSLWPAAELSVLAQLEYLRD